MTGGPSATPRAGEEYPKPPFDSIRGEETTVGSPGADPDPQRLGAFRAVPLVGGACSVDVNPCVNITTGESNSEKPPRGRARLAWAFHTRPTVDVDVFAGHLPHPPYVLHSTHSVGLAPPGYRQTASFRRSACAGRPHKSAFVCPGRRRALDRARRPHDRAHRQELKLLELDTCGRLL